jgi:hypothetical protein
MQAEEESAKRDTTEDMQNCIKYSREGGDKAENKEKVVNEEISENEVKKKNRIIIIISLKWLNI